MSFFNIWIDFPYSFPTWASFHKTKELHPKRGAWKWGNHNSGIRAVLKWVRMPTREWVLSCLRPNKAQLLIILQQQQLEIPINWFQTGRMHLTLWPTKEGMEFIFPNLPYNQSTLSPTSNVKINPQHKFYVGISPPNSPFLYLQKWTKMDWPTFS